MTAVSGLALLQNASSKLSPSLSSLPHLLEFRAGAFEAALLKMLAEGPLCLPKRRLALYLGCEEIELGHVRQRMRGKRVLVEDLCPRDRNTVVLKSFGDARDCGHHGSIPARGSRATATRARP